MFPLQENMVSRAVLRFGVCKYFLFQCHTILGKDVLPFRCCRPMLHLYSCVFRSTGTFVMSSLCQKYISIKHQMQSYYCTILELKLLWFASVLELIFWTGIGHETIKAIEINVFYTPTWTILNTWRLKYLVFPHYVK